MPSGRALWSLAEEVLPGSTSISRSNWTRFLIDSVYQILHRWSWEHNKPPLGTMQYQGPRSRPVLSAPNNSRGQQGHPRTSCCPSCTPWDAPGGAS